MTESITRAINTVLESSSEDARPDAELLLSEFHDILVITRGIEQADTEIDADLLSSLNSDTQATEKH